MKAWYLVSGVTLAGSPRVFRVKADSRAQVEAAAEAAGLGEETIIMSKRDIDRLGPDGSSLEMLMRTAPRLEIESDALPMVTTGSSAGAPLLAA